MEAFGRLDIVVNNAAPTDVIKSGGAFANICCRVAGHPRHAGMRRIQGCARGDHEAGRARFITGAKIPVDGGLTVKMIAPDVSGFYRDTVEATE